MSESPSPLTAAPLTAMAEAYRPLLHFSAQRHWINDPNGLVWHDGEYHLFYQHNPEAMVWGHMSWGHAVSTDLLHWQELPLAIAEDARHMIFSGSAVVDPANSSGFGQAGGPPPLVAVYTGHEPREGGHQSQCLAYSLDRGRTFTKYAGNPVLDIAEANFRDPKVFWHAPTQRWIMLVVLAHAHCAQFYASEDLKFWQYLSDFQRHELATGPSGIWECPDLFELPLLAADGASTGQTAWVLKVDVFDGHLNGSSGGVYWVGHFDGQRFTADEANGPHPGWTDLGSDFYAAIAWNGMPPGDTRCVWIGWMNNHRYAQQLPSAPFRGAMSLPRALSLARRGGQWALRQWPLAELEAQRGTALAAAAALSAQALTPGVHALHTHGQGPAWDIELNLLPQDATECGLLLALGEAQRTVVGWCARSQVVFIDRSASGLAPEGADFAARLCAPWPLEAGAALRLRVVIDACSVEVFAGDGELAITAQIFPSADSQGLALYALGGSAQVQRLAIWPLVSIRG